MELQVEEEGIDEGGEAYIPHCGEMLTFKTRREQIKESKDTC